jgi:hypothetical protein
MNTSPDRRLAAANPLRDHALEALSLEAALDIGEAILHEPRPRPGPARASRAWRRPALAITCVAALAGVLSMSIFTGDNGSSRAWAAPALRVAHAVPRVLVSLPAWHVTRADEFSVNHGEMTFGDGARSVELRWSTDRGMAAKLGDRLHSGTTRRADATVLGTTAAVFRYDGAVDDFTALWTLEGYSLELRGSLPADEFTAVLRSLRVVSVDDWLGAMPATVVTPAHTAETVDAMLRDMTLPAGFDRAGLRVDENVRDRYQLGARVAGAVACAWIERWIAARRQGDDRGVREAVAALAGSKDWAVLQEMQRDGAYPDVLWQYADAVAVGGFVQAGKRLSVEDSYRSALGCP